MSCSGQRFVRAVVGVGELIWAVKRERLILTPGFGDVSAWLASCVVPGLC